MIGLRWDHLTANSCDIITLLLCPSFYVSVSPFTLHGHRGPQFGLRTVNLKVGSFDTCLPRAVPCCPRSPSTDLSCLSHPLGLCGRDLSSPPDGSFLRGETGCPGPEGAQSLLQTGNLGKSAQRIALSEAFKIITLACFC